MKNSIKKLSDYSHLRLRPNMYLGSIEPHTQSIVLYDGLQPRVAEVTWTPALFTCLREIIDNALDEIVGHGHGNRIDITYDATNLVFSVQDNGRGIPIGFDDHHKQHLATMVLTEPRAGRNFDERGEVAGVNGIGSAAVSNTSEWFEVEIHRDGKKFKQTFREGLPGATELDVTAPKITSVKGDKTGTFIKFHPSKEVFKSRLLPEDFIRSRVTEVAICNPTLKIFYNDEPIRVKLRQEQSLFPDLKPIVIEINEGTLRSKFWIIPGEGSEHVHSLVNNIPVFNGGVHIDAFRRLFYAGMLDGLARESKRRKLTPNRSDIQDGLFIYNITNMMAPNFDSQSKTRLINEEVASVMKKHLSDADLYKELIKRNPEWINEIYSRCEDRTKKKDASDLAKLNKASKRQKVEKLSDATGLDRSKCILFLAEGDCLHENTEVIVATGSDFSTRRIGDLAIGDMVISHTNRLQRVTAISRKIAKTVTINTAKGPIMGTGAHRMLCHDRADDTIKWLKIDELVPQQHRLIRNRVGDVGSYAEVVSNERTDDDIYRNKIVFINPHNGETQFEIASDAHQYGVFDIADMAFKKVTAMEIDPDRHVMLIA